MMTPDLVAKVENKVLETLERAQTVYRRIFNVPSIEYRDMGRVAGKAIAVFNKVVYSPTLLAENQERFLNRTVPHEIAHLVTAIVYPRAKQAHGPEWRSVMQALGVTDNSRCHSYDTSSVAKPRQHRSPRARNFIAKCQCQEHNITITLYRRMVRGQSYKCRKCNSKLVLA